MERILVVDDQPENLALLRVFLKKADYDVQIATSGTEALTVLGDTDNATMPVLVLLDIMMPDIDGLETLRVIKTMPHHEDTPVIMVTSSHDVSLLTQAFSLGAFDYVEKPVRKEELLARVRSALRLSGEIKERKRSQAELVATAVRLERANAILQELALVDELTKIPNRRHSDQILAAEWRNALREQEPLGVALLDIDFFKKYNDNLGHLQGDACLHSVAQAAQATLKRARDFVARYGGEEFLVLLPETNSESALAVAERVRAAIEGLELPHPDSTASPWVTVSIGVATTIPQADRAASDLVARADKALYKAKQSGRNCVALQSG